jgi:glutathione S-transferase
LVVDGDGVLAQCGWSGGDPILKITGQATGKGRRPMSKPILYVFAISHYCEKARWALDYLDIAYEIRYLAPGLHRDIAKKLGVPHTSLPILAAGDHVVQGSAAIIDWADARSATTAKRLTPSTAREECVGLEKRLDDVAGIHARRYYYSEAMVDHPETVRPIFTKDIPILHKLLVGWRWNLIRKLMIERMDLGPEQREDSKRILEGELNWLDGLLFGGRNFLVGNQLSRADIAAASLLAPLATPPEHPTYARLRLPPRCAAEVANWESRPSIKWVRAIYREYR